jgi:hypothetical protein
MNAQRAADIIAASGQVTLRIDGTRVALLSLTPAQLELVKISRQRIGTWAFARKWARACESLEEIERAQKGLPAPSLAAAPVTCDPTRAQGVAMESKTSILQPDSLALVPYVATASPTSPVQTAKENAPTRALHSYWMHCQNSWSWRYLVLSYRLLCNILLLGPIFMLWLLLAYACLTIIYIVTHPEILVTSLFRVLGLAPAYATYVAERLLSQLQTELSQRLPLVR